MKDPPKTITKHTTGNIAIDIDQKQRDGKKIPKKGLDRDRYVRRGAKKIDSTTSAA